MKYDDATWHSEGNFPIELPDSAGATHIGMFLAWNLLNGLASELHLEASPKFLNQLRNRELTPGKYLIRACDGKFTADDLNKEGNEFCLFYYEDDEGEFLDDYEEILGAGFPSLYHVEDTWENYDKICPIFNSRLQEWRED